jgi:hypothetical protein
MRIAEICDFRDVYSSQRLGGVWKLQAWVAGGEPGLQATRSLT